MECCGHAKIIYAYSEVQKAAFHTFLIDPYNNTILKTTTYCSSNFDVSDGKGTHQDVSNYKFQCFLQLEISSKIC